MRTLAGMWRTPYGQVLLKLSMLITFEMFAIKKQSSACAIYQLAIKCGMELRYVTIALVKIKINTYSDQWVSQLQFRVILPYSL